MLVSLPCIVTKETRRVFGMYDSHTGGEGVKKQDNNVNYYFFLITKS